MKKIIKNAIKCNLCGEVIESRYVHEMVWCKCHSCAVDGGHEYLRRCYATDKPCFQELSEYEDEKEKSYDTATEYEWKHREQGLI